MEYGEKAFVKTITFRAANPGDAERIQLITERAIAARKGITIPETVQKPEYIHQHEVELVKENSWSRLAFDGNRLMGLALCEPSIEDHKRQHLTLLMIDPDYWGIGVGSSLLEWLEQDMKNLGVRSIEIWTGVNNQRSQALYSRKGYVPTGLLGNIHGEQAQFVKILD